MPLAASQPPSWMDDFIDFASVKRNSHRRSSSDPIEFVETPFTNESRGSNRNDSLIPSSNTNGFDRLDDEQLSSMFSDDDVTANFQSMKSSISSTLSDQNSDNEEAKTTSFQEQQLKNEPGEVEDGDGGNYEQETADSVKPQITFSSDGSTIIDPKRVKRYNS